MHSISILPAAIRQRNAINTHPVRHRANASGSLPGRRDAVDRAADLRHIVPHGDLDRTAPPRPPPALMLQVNLAERIEADSRETNNMNPVFSRRCASRTIDSSERPTGGRSIMLCPFQTRRRLQTHIQVTTRPFNTVVRSLCVNVREPVWSAAVNSSFTFTAIALLGSARCLDLRSLNRRPQLFNRYRLRPALPPTNTRHFDRIGSVRQHASTAW